MVLEISCFVNFDITATIKEDRQMVENTRPIVNGNRPFFLDILQG